MSTVSESPLKRFLDFDTLPHALLFVGDSEEQMLSVSRQFVQEVFLHFDKDAEKASKVERGVHPDLHLVEPLSKTGYYTIEQIKEVSQQATYFPNESSRQFFIFKNADRMTDSAANALLKTLEEPTKNTFFILLARNLDLILPTIQSRVQKIDFSELSQNQSSKYVETLENFLTEHPIFNMNDLCLVCENIQKEFDQAMTKASKQNQTFYVDEESRKILLSVERWYQKHYLLAANNTIPYAIFSKRILQAKTAIERSIKLSVCLKYLLLDFVT